MPKVSEILIKQFNLPEISANEWADHPSLEAFITVISPVTFFIGFLDEAGNCWFSRVPDAKGDYEPVFAEAVMELERVAIENPSVLFGGKMLTLYTGECEERTLTSGSVH